MAIETAGLNPNSLMDVLADLVRKQGIIVVVLLALMYFIWDSGKNKRADDAKLAPIIEKNTEVISKNTVIQEIAIQAGKDNKIVIDGAKSVLERVERKMDRRAN